MPGVLDTPLLPAEPSCIRISHTQTCYGEVHEEHPPPTPPFTALFWYSRCSSVSPHTPRQAIVAYSEDCCQDTSEKRASRVLKVRFRGTHRGLFV